MSTLTHQILSSVRDFYLNSRDYNGFPTIKIDGKEDEIESAIKELIQDGSVVINFGDRHPNPHILAFNPEDTAKELAKFDEYDWRSACLYPSKGLLADAVNDDQLRDQPYSRLLRLGEPQLGMHFFELTVLEIYRNDPRYHYDVGDIQGEISVKTEFYDGAQMRQEDKTFLQTFGFGYSTDLSIRVVAAFNWYLSRMAAEHQQIWKAKEVYGEYFAHPDYIRTTSGHFPERASILVAFLEELRQINELSARMGRSRFFRRDFCENSRPREFAFLLRPTLREYQNFVHILDKMMSENINRDFFQNDVPYEREVEEKDGRIKRVPLNSITILEDWLAMYFRSENPEPLQNMIKTFRNVREGRQPSAHSVEDDSFDLQLLSRQRDLIQDVYNAVRTLRLIFMNHSSASDYNPPGWLQESRFWVY